MTVEQTKERDAHNAETVQITKPANTSNTSKASQPTKAGGTPVNIQPKVKYEDVAAVALQHIDALLKGGTDAVMFIASALLVGYLDQRVGSKGVKLSVIRDEFALMLKKKGLGETQTRKYIDYGQTLAARMFKECQYGMEMAALIAATKPKAAHDAVVAYVSRHCTGKKTEHGYKLSEALGKLNVLAVWLGKDADPNKPEPLAETDAEKRQKELKARKVLAERIGKDPAVLNQVDSSRLVETVAKVITFDVLVSKHVLTVSTANKLREELAAIQKAYRDRIAALETEIGKKQTPKAKRSQLKELKKAA
jgi:hypothetical protein